MRVRACIPFFSGKQQFAQHVAVNGVRKKDRVQGQRRLTVDCKKRQGQGQGQGPSVGDTVINERQLNDKAVDETYNVQRQWRRGRV